MWYHRYLKDFDYYDKCYHEREKEDRLLFKRGSNNGGCLCFSRTGSDGMVAGLAWRRLLLTAAMLLALTALAGAAIVLLWSRPLVATRSRLVLQAPPRATVWYSLSNISSFSATEELIFSSRAHISSSTRFHLFALMRTKLFFFQSLSSWQIVITIFWPKVFGFWSCA